MLGNFLFLSSLVLIVSFPTVELRVDKLHFRYPFDLPKGVGPWVKPSLGAIWPEPQLQQTLNSFMVLRPLNFQFKITSSSCDIIEEAAQRYYKTIFISQQNERKPFIDYQIEAKDIFGKQFKGYLDTVTIEILQPCESLPSLSMDEHYCIKINTPDRPGEGAIMSETVWGALRGLESFSQLVHPTSRGFAYQINSTLIMDYPRFTHRGLLLDSSRHFLSVDIIKENLDLMTMNKLNVFHWHLTDDPSFPYRSKKFPSLSQLGAFNQYTHVYSPADVQEVIEYARKRGIRVIPEFDTPGHTQSWGPGIPGLLTKCFSQDGSAQDYYGPINPVTSLNYKFLKEFFQEVFEVFPDSYVHLGGDEVEFDCWASNPQIKDFMKERGWGGDFSRLEQYYMQKLINITQDSTQGNMSYIVWQEVVDNNVSLPKDTVIHVWKDGSKFQDELHRITKLGFRTLLSSPWYLNYVNYGVDWDRFYTVEPLNFSGTEEQKRLVIGGEACMWGEFVDATNVITATWPRASAVAERLWSKAEVNSPKQAAPRLEEHRCRMLSRGYKVNSINGVGFCDFE